MFENPIFQFALELVRALIVDALSGRVRLHIARLARFRAPGYRGTLLRIHRRNRDRLLNRLYTGQTKQV